MSKEKLTTEEIENNFNGLLEDIDLLEKEKSKFNINYHFMSVLWKS